MSGLEGKKKTLTEKIFGNNKENRPAAGGGVMPVAYHELETILDKERAKNKKLVSQLGKARAEVVALKTCRAHLGGGCRHSGDSRPESPGRREGHGPQHSPQAAAGRQQEDDQVPRLPGHHRLHDDVLGVQVHFLFMSLRFCVS